MADLLPGDGQFRLLTTNSVAVAGVAAGGRLARASLIGGSATIPMSPLGGFFPAGRFRGFRAGFCLVGADNVTATYKLWRCMRGLVNRQEVDYEVQAVGTGNIQASLLVGVAATAAAGLVLSTERIADTVDFTPNAGWTAMQNARGQGIGAAYADANDANPGWLDMPDGGGCSAWILELIKGTCTSVNAWVELTS